MTTDESDSKCLTHVKIVVHGYPGCADAEPLRECIDKAEESKVVTCRSVDYNDYFWPYPAMLLLVGVVVK